MVRGIDKYYYLIFDKELDILQFPYIAEMLRHYQEIMPLFPSFTFVKQLFTKHPAALREP